MMQSIPCKKNICLPQLIRFWQQITFHWLEPYPLQHSCLDKSPIISDYGLAFLFFYKIYTPRELNALLRTAPAHIRKDFEIFFHIKIYDTYEKNQSFLSKDWSQRPIVLNPLPIELCLFDILCILQPEIIREFLLDHDFLSFVLNTSSLKDRLNDLQENLSRHQIPENFSQWLLFLPTNSDHLFLFDEKYRNALDGLIPFFQQWEILVPRKTRTLELVIFKITIQNHWREYLIKIHIHQIVIFNSILITALKRTHLDNFTILFDMLNPITALRYLEKMHHYSCQSLLKLAVEFDCIEQLIPIMSNLYQKKYPLQNESLYSNKILKMMCINNSWLFENIIVFKAYRSLMAILTEMDRISFSDLKMMMNDDRFESLLHTIEKLEEMSVDIQQKINLRGQYLFQLSQKILINHSSLKINQTDIDRFLLRFSSPHLESKDEIALLAFHRILKEIMENILSRLDDPAHSPDSDDILLWIHTICILKTCPFNHYQENTFLFFQIVKKCSHVLLNHRSDSQCDPVIRLYQKIQEWLLANPEFRTDWLTHESFFDHSIVCYFVYPLLCQNHVATMGIKLHLRVQSYCDCIQKSLDHSNPQSYPHPIESNWVTAIISTMIFNLELKMNLYWAELLQICIQNWSSEMWKQWKTVHIAIMMHLKGSSFEEHEHTLNQIVMKSRAIMSAAEYTKARYTASDPKFICTPEQEVVILQQYSVIFSERAQQLITSDFYQDCASPTPLIFQDHPISHSHECSHQNHQQKFECSPKNPVNFE